MTGPFVTSLAFANASTSEVSSGLLGYVSCVVGDVLLLDGITLRRTRQGRLTLSFPARRDSTGKQHPYIRPLNEAARRNIEDQIFAKLGIEQETAP